MLNPSRALAAGLLLLHGSCAAALRTAGGRLLPQNLLGERFGFESHLPATAFQGPETRLRPTLLHFMFELKDEFPHPGVWGEFFEAAQPGSLRVWAHCTDYTACKNDYSFDLLNVRLVPKTFSVRGADLMTPFVHMIRHALEETKHLAASGVMEKFLVVSDSTLPIKPFSYAYWELASNPASDICISSVDQWSHGMVDGVPTALVKQHQWVALNRSDASVLARDWQKRVTKILEWDVPLKEGRWAGQNRTVPRQQWKGGTWYTATDEEAVWAFLHGPMELRSLQDLEEPLRVFNTRRCHTYVAFPNDFEKLANATRKNRTGLHPSLLQMEAEAHSRFNHMSITGHLVRDPDTKMTVPPGIWHPYLIEALGNKSLKVLRRSPYLFARKFSSCAKLPHYSAHVLRN